MAGSSLDGEMGGGAVMDPELRSRERTIIRTPMIIIIATITT